MAKPLKKVTIKSLVGSGTPARVPIKSIKPHPDNPNIRTDIDDIVDSLEDTGQYKRVSVQKSTKYIIAGNHVWEGAKKMKWTEIDVEWLDVDDETALRILANDNKTAQGAVIDDVKIAHLLSKLPDPHVGTGYSMNEVDSLLKEVHLSIEDSLKDLDETTAASQERDKNEKHLKSFKGSPLGEEGDYLDDEDDSDQTSFEKQPESLTGSNFELKPMDDFVFPTAGYWGIPQLDPDKLMTFDELPDGLETWAGSATKDDDDPDRWWLYNFGVDSTSGMKDISKVIMSFYTWDEYFENWWHYPEKFVTKTLNSGVKYAVTPNFSQWGDLPKVACLWSLYRSRALGRYMQECGLRVIPDVEWPFGDKAFLEKHVLGTLPKNLPMISIQMQAFSPEEAKDKKKGYREQFQAVFDTLSPQGLLLYTGTPGYKWFTKNIKYDGPVKRLETRNNKLAISNKKREKKTTI